MAVVVGVAVAVAGCADADDVVSRDPEPSVIRVVLPTPSARSGVVAVYRRGRPGRVTVELRPPVRGGVLSLTVERKDEGIWLPVLSSRVRTDESGLGSIPIRALPPDPYRVRATFIGNERRRGGASAWRYFVVR